MAGRRNTACLTIDGREVEVPAGTGLVEAAEALGIEIPVFCYEPRIGPAVGACRMCLVEIEGMPKLQTACSTPVRDGMVVSTANGRARDAQEAVLEFLLINHPLDCPVCDKGGECPLQDHAFRWGPGASRFLELKRNSDKPIPISPLIALDRERCILCYRCTRFSSEVSGDDQLIARERGGSSVIATFEGRPYEGHFSGNVIELCPVGALTSTEYRFKARPWEAPDHPSVCNQCPVGCNTYNTVREGRVVRVLARENDAVDEGWLCDKGRFSYPALYAPERIGAPQVRSHRERPPGNRPVTTVSHEGAMEWLFQRLAEDRTAGAPGATWVLSGSETLEEAYAVQQLAQATGGRVVAVEGASAAGPDPALAASIADLAAARHILVVGNADLAETAPILDLRVRKAITAGAHVTVAGIGGTRLEAAGAHHQFVAPGGLDAWVRQYVAQVKQTIGGNELTDPGVLVTFDGELSAESLAALAEVYQLTREGSGIVSIPRAANARGLAALGIEALPIDGVAVGEGLVFFNVDPSAHWPETEWRPLVPKAKWVAAVGLLHTTLHSVADLVIPATAGAEKEGSIVNLEGRLQRLTPAASPPEEARGELSWLAGLVRRFGGELPAYPAGAFRVLADSTGAALPAASYGDIPHEGVLGVHGGSAPQVVTQQLPTTSGDELTVYVAPFLYDAPEVRAAPRMQFLRAATWVTLARDDARVRGLQRGDDVRLGLDGYEVAAKVAVSRRIAPGFARVFAGAPGVPAGLRGFHAASVAKVDAPQGAPA